MNSAVVEKNFSRNARYYDGYCGMQNICASELISRMNGREFGEILDLGCGTGNFTRLLRKRFSGAGITAVDISGAMVEIAKEKLKDGGVEFIVEDVEKLESDKRYDLITSSAVFHWLEDIDATLTKYRSLLKDGGVTAFSMFGPGTFCELGTSLEELFGKKVEVSSSGFPDYIRLAGLMKRHFTKSVVQEKIYREEYGSLNELMRNIKYTGTRGRGARNSGIWTGGMMRDLERIYREKFKKITATYQVYFCEGSI